MSPKETGIGIEHLKIVCQKGTFQMSSLTFLACSLSINHEEEDTFHT